MNKYWSRKVNEIVPYVPGEQPKDKKYIKLNTNENPYPPSPKALEAMQAAADSSLKLYPDPNCTALRNAIALKYGLDASQVFTGNGSDEILAFSFLAFFDSGREILFPDISYSFYPVYASFFSIGYRTVQVDEDFTVPVQPFLEPNGGILISNPNSPTGKCMPLEAIKKILESNTESVVIIDEAYIDFGGESAVKLIPEFPNLLVIQTLSKSRSLAGLRVGYAMGHSDLIQGLNRVKNSFNSYTSDRISLAGAAEAVLDEEYFRENCSSVIRTRDRVVKRLKETGFRVIDSKANFIFISHSSVEAADIFTRLRDMGILVRHFSSARISNFLRVSIGSDSEMDSFLDAIVQILNECSKK